LISYFNQMRRHGYPVLEAVMRGAELRVRPVVMTSLTAALGLLPAALANSIGSQAQKPLAIVVVGAMLITLFLTRYLMPVLYSLFPGPVSEGGAVEELSEGSHYSDEFLPALLGRQARQGSADDVESGEHSKGQRIE
jgi:cobalt-zinc-cadmium resistance protein CzcA